MSELSRVEDLLKTGVEEPVLPMSRLEAILRGEKITPQSRVEELLLQYNPSDILIEKRITANGTYFAVNDNADGYFKVVVDTPVTPSVVLDHLVETITENGTYTYTPEHDGFEDAEITVDVPSVTPVLDDITITNNGIYTSEHDGFGTVTVEVSGGTLDPNYNYYKAANDTIVVRVYHEGESDENIKWFFCGYSKEADDADVPSNLLEYVPTLSTSITSRAMSPTKDESSYDFWIGWSSSIGNLKIRSWNSSWGATAAGTFWAVIDTSNGDEQMNAYEDPYVYQPESDSYVFLEDGKVPSNQGTTYLTPDKAFTTNTWYNLAVVANNKTFIFATYWEGNNGTEYSFKPDSSTTYYISIYYDGTVKVRCSSGSWYAMDVCVTQIRDDYIPSNS